MTNFLLSNESLKVAGVANISFHTCRYCIEAYNDKLFSELNIYYPEHLITAVNKRKAEYLAGRFCASMALADSGVRNFDVKTGKHRAPIWPQHLRGSITHTGSQAYAAVASVGDYKYLGIDYEKIVTLKTAENIGSMVVDDHERDLLMQSFSDVALALSIAFSSKESLFKALYPYVGEYFDFLTASITRLSIDEGSLELKLKKTLSNRVVEGSCFRCLFFLERDHVLTFLAI